MNILIVEDDENKQQQITNFIQEIFSPNNIKIARSLHSGLKTIIQGNIDLIILDMTMPTFDITPDEHGGRPQAYGGRDILRQMDRREITIPVIVVTQFDHFGEGDSKLTLEELDQQLRHTHSTYYLGIVYYNVSKTGWKEKLKMFIDKLSTK